MDVSKTSFVYTLSLTSRRPSTSYASTVTKDTQRMIKNDYLCLIYMKHKLLRMNKTYQLLKDVHGHSFETCKCFLYQLLRFPFSEFTSSLINF